MSLSNKLQLLFYITGITFGVIYFVLLYQHFNPQVKEFDIDGGTFDQTVHVIITEDTSYALRYVKENNDSSATTNDFNSRGTTFPSVDGSPVVIWLPNQDDAVIVDHELFHATIAVMRWAGVEWNGDTEEAYAYEFQYLRKQFK